MSREHVEDGSSRAAALEKRYDWLEASELHEHALQDFDEEDFFGRGEVQEKIGRCLHRAAFQAGSREEFQARMRGAVETYDVARGLYERVANERGGGWAFRSKALAKYLHHWLMPDPSEKRKYLDECLELSRKAATIFWENEDMLEYGRTYNELIWVFYLRFYFEWDGQASKKIIDEAITWGEKAIAVLSKLNDFYEIARAYITLAMNLVKLRYYFTAESEEKDKIVLKSVEHLEKALNFSKRIGDAYLIGLSHYFLGVNKGGEESIRHFKQAMECGEKIQDNFLKGMALNCASHMTFWDVIATEDPDERMKLAEKAIELYNKAQQNFSIISYPNQCGREVSPAEYYLYLAIWEIDREKKLEFLEKSEKAGMEALKEVENSDIPYAVRTVSNILSRTLQERARMELNLENKKRLLKNALKYREKTIEIMEMWPFGYRDLAEMYNYLADIEAELGYLEPDITRKRKLLEEAVSNKEKCLLLTEKMVSYLDKLGRTSIFAELYSYQDTYGTLLNSLYKITNNIENLKRVIDISQKATRSASKLDMFSRIAESHWKIAKAQINLGEHVEAAENFELASESYGKAAEKIPQLKDFYKEYASYMLAWVEFERAKQSHMEKRYMIAKEHYEKAAELHKSTERWSYMAPNYLAWARLEEAEDLSRREETEEARDLFQQATGLFEEAKGSIEIKLRTIQDEEERELLVSLAQASDIRRDYCLGRNALEEGRILDRQGDHLASSRRYGSAAETFQRIAGTSEEAQMELQPLICLCQAWQKMTQAEARASPELYSEAAKLFEEAKEYNPDEKSRRLALGHSCFCRALEAGARFEYTRDLGYYTEATRQLEGAASYYVRAGFKGAADYAEATQRLFDAYVYMENASKETDPQKKARWYMMAERVLETSAGSYLTAKHPEKSKEVERLLGRVRERREMATSLSEVLHAPITVSTTEAFTALTPTREEAVGLDRFENADIRANLILEGKEVKVGDDVEIEIELVNAGKAPAQLIKVEEIIPEDFEVRKAPETCRVEDSFIDMKGRSLSPLKTVELKLILKPLNKGTYILKPRILFLDESGKYRSHEPEPATIVVKELGIKGWLRGPTR